MTTPRVIELPEDDATVERLYEHAIDADDASVGQVYTVEDDPDHAGHKRAAFKDSGTDPGIPTGTPANLTIVLGAFGLELIISAVPAATTRVAEGDTGPRSVNFGSVGAIRVQVPVIAAGPAGSKVVVRGLPYVGADWVELCEVPIDAVLDSDGDVLSVPGDWTAIDPSCAIDNLQIDWAVSGGDDATEAIIGVVQVDTLSVADDVPPPSDTPGPEIPTDGMVAEWLFTETSGQICANKIVGGVTADLVFGATTSTETDADPVRETSPRRLRFESTAFGTNYRFAQCAFASALVSSGAAIVLYVDMTTLGGLPKYLCGLRTTGGSGINDHYIRINASNKVEVLVTQASGTTDKVATSTTSITNGTKHLVALCHDGTNVMVGIDGVWEDTEPCSAAADNAARTLYIGTGSAPPTSIGGPDTWRAGDVRFYAGSAGAIAVRDNFEEIAAAYRLIYTDIPVP